MGMTRFILNIVIFFSYCCLQATQNKIVLTEEQRVLFNAWNINENGIARVRRGVEYTNYAFSSLAYPLEERVRNVVNKDELDGIKKEFNKILAVVLKSNQNAGYDFLKNFIGADYFWQFFFDKNIAIEEFIPDRIEDLLPRFQSDALYLFISRDPKVINYFIYNHGLGVNHETLTFIKGDIKRHGFRVGDTFYNCDKQKFSFKHLVDQGPESRVNFFKEMFKPEKAVVMNWFKANLTTLLCLKRLVNEKKITKAPKTIVNILLRLATLNNPCWRVTDAVTAYKREHDKKEPQDEVDQFLCKNFHEWYNSDLK